MKHLLKLFLFAIAILTTGTIITTSCSNTDELKMDASQDDAQVKTRAVGNKTPKLGIYIETNDVNPLNAGEYYFVNSSTEEVIDYVILFASNIRGTRDSVWLHHNDNQQHILDNVNTLVRPLQQKGIKVLLGLLGDHTIMGLANLTPTKRASFAQQVANCVNTYGLDGADCDDEYSNYPAYPDSLYASSAKFGDFIQELRQLLPNKLITLFRFGSNANVNQASMNALDYMWPNFGCNSYPPVGLGNSKWAKLSVRINPLVPGAGTINSCANNYGNFGAIMGFNLIPTQYSADVMNEFANRVWGDSVRWSGTTHQHW